MRKAVSDAETLEAINAIVFLLGTLYIAKEKEKYEMEKTLHTIQVLSKIGKILSKIAMICCIVGAAGCLAGIISCAIGAPKVLKFGGVTIHNIIETESGMSAAQMYAYMAGAMIFFAANAVLAGFAAQYFKNELKAGTPFTIDGAKEMQRLGILGICLPVGGKVVAEIVCAIMAAVLIAPKPDFDFEISVGVGIAFLVVSVLCRYAAEKELQKSER